MIRKISPLSSGDGTRIMSYNVLAQCLVRRDQFPTSGKFLRWGNRSKVFPKEIEAYSPDILLLQEVDNEHRQFWRQMLEPHGYHCVFYHHPSKKHGLAICFKTHKYKVLQEYRLDLDSIVTPGVPRQCDTKNVALFAELGFVQESHGASGEEISELEATGNSEAKSTQKGQDTTSTTHPGTVLIGTSHFYWHPEASYERSRQFLCVFDYLQTICKPGQIQFFGGDFNTEHFDPPYLLATAGQVTSTSQAADIMHKSISVRSFDKMGAVRMENGVGVSDKVEIEQSTNPSLLCVDEDPGSSSALNALLSAFKNHPLRATSFYSNYSRTGRESAECGEPKYTNWTEIFKGTLDYLFCMHEKDKQCPVQVLKLLDIATVEELGQSGLPKQAASPSDHVCIMAEVEFT